VLHRHWLHAYGLPNEALAAYEVLLPQNLEHAVRDAATDKLREDLARVESAGLSGQSHITQSDPSRAIVEAAAQLEARWIVMGTHGHSGLEQLLLGSVAERIPRDELLTDWNNDYAAFIVALTKRLNSADSDGERRQIMKRLQGAL